MDKKKMIERLTEKIKDDVEKGAEDFNKELRATLSPEMNKREAIFFKNGYLRGIELIVKRMVESEDRNK